MRVRNQFVLILIALLALGSGCKKKRPPVPQPQEQAPTISAPPPQPEPPAPSATTQPPATTPPPTASKPPAKTHKKPSAAKKTVPKPAEPKPEQPKSSKTVVNDGSTSTEGGQLSAGLPRAEAAHQRQTTVQLQQATESNLRGVTRALTAEEQSMVQQIRAYLQQSRAADADGDTERAYNLAMKARLLSDELIKR